MNFLGVGPLEFLVIIIVALIFVGPERLPRLAADVARTIRELRKYTTAIADEFGEVMKDFEKDTEGERGELTKLSETLTGATKSVTETIRGRPGRCGGQTSGGFEWRLAIRGGSRTAVEGHPRARRAAHNGAPASASGERASPGAGERSCGGR